jgi:dihydroneopterin aldolase
VSDPLVIEVVGLELHAFHGVHDYEQRDGQRFVIDLRAVPLSAAACETDRLRDAVHYGELAVIAVKVARERRFALIERLAAAIGDALLTRFPLERVTVTVHKPDAPIEPPKHDVMVHVTRVRAGHA